jgi:hypothetical protein
MTVLRKAMFFAGALTCLALVASDHPPVRANNDDNVRIDEYVPTGDSLPACNHILFHGSRQIVTSSDRLFHRDSPEQPLVASPLAGLHGAHSVAFDPRERLYYVCDSENHRLIAFPDPASDQIAKVIPRLAGIELDRPHDVVVDERDGWIYVLNPNRPTLFRCRTFGEGESSLDLSGELGYSRALSLVDGRLYVVGSSAGAIVEIEDFAAGAYRVHRSHGKKRDAPAGSWTTTGLVPNDADWFDGHWYVTSYFCPEYAGDSDYDENKLIRFRDWKDFASGDWEDLSKLLPPTVVPYYLTPQDGALFIAAFSHERRGTADRVYRLSKGSR